MRHLVSAACVFLGLLASAHALERDHVTFNVCPEARLAGIIDTPDSWLHIEFDLRTEFPEANAALPRIQQIASALKTQGVTLVPVILPLRPMVASTTSGSPLGPLMEYDRLKALNNFDRFVQSLDRLGIPAVNPAPSMLAQGRLKKMFFQGDHHITPEGAAVIARATAGKIKGLEAYNLLEKSRFVTTALPPIPHPDPSRTSLVTRLCRGVAQPQEVVRLTQTRPAEEKADLLSDDLPEVVYVGTSNGRPMWNLVGNLEQFLKVPILDEHIEAGGAYNSMLNYLLSSSYRHNKPKIIIWEWSIEESLYNREGALPFSSPETYAQVVPAIYGECSGKVRVDSATSGLPNSSDLFSSKIYKLPASSYNYLHLRFDDLSVIALKVRFNAGKPDEAWRELHLPTRMENKGNVFVEVPSSLQTLTSVAVSAPPTAQGKLVATLCQVRMAD